MKEAIEYRVTWKRRDRNERQYHPCRTIVSARNKIRKLELAGYTDIRLDRRTVLQGEWANVE